MSYQPPTGAAGAVTGFATQQNGTTTIRWHGRGLISSINGVPGVLFLVVTDFDERPEVENIPVTNNEGVKTDRGQIVHGTIWSLTVRDDIRMGLPRVGTQVVVADLKGLIGTTGAGGVANYYSATVTDGGYRSVPKTPGEHTITCERATLIEPFLAGAVNGS